MKWYRLEGIPDNGLDEGTSTVTDSIAFVELPKSARKVRGHRSCTTRASSVTYRTSEPSPAVSDCSVVPMTMVTASLKGSSLGSPPKRGLVVRQLHSARDHSTRGLASVLCRLEKESLQDRHSSSVSTCSTPKFDRAADKSSCSLGRSTSALDDSIHAFPTGQHFASPPVAPCVLGNVSNDKVTRLSTGSSRHPPEEEREPASHAGSLNDLWKQLTAMDLRSQSDTDDGFRRGDNTTTCTCSQLRSLREQLPTEMGGRVSRPAATDLQTNQLFLHQTSSALSPRHVPDMAHGKPKHINETSLIKYNPMADEERRQQVGASVQTGFDQPQDRQKAPFVEGRQPAEAAVHHIPTMLPLTLQGSFNQRMACFIARSKARQERILHARHKRLHQRSNQDGAVDRPFPKEPVIQQCRVPAFVNRLHHPIRRYIDHREMIETTKRKCTNLPEVRQKRLEQERQERCRLNRLRAKAFERKVTQAVLAKHAKREKYWW